MTARHLQRGDNAEKLARLWLEQRGLKCLAANFRCKAGELDLVMLDQECLVVVEVRYRINASRGGPLASISQAKQQKICRATQFFLRCHPSLTRHPLRFDAVAVSGPPDAMTVDWCKRAFDAEFR